MVKEGTSAVYWKEKRDYLFANMHTPLHQVILWVKKEIHQIVIIRVWVLWM